MKKLLHFWQAIESTVGLSAVPAQWRCALADDWEWAQQFLRPTDLIADCYPKLQDEPESPLAYRVVCHDEGEGTFVGVCPEGTERISLRRDQLVILELNLEGLAKQMAAALGLVFDFEELAHPEHVHRIGVFSPLGAEEAWVYFAVPPESDDLRQIAAVLAAEIDRHVLILTPTKQSWRLNSRSQRQSRVHFAALEELLVLGNTNSLVATAPMPRLVGFVPAARPDGVYPPRTIVWCGRECQCDLTKAQIAFLDHALKAQDVSLHTIMNKVDGLVWKERYINTQPTRDKISQFLSRLNVRLSKAQPSLGISFTLGRDADFILRNDPVPKQTDTSLTED